MNKLKIGTRNSPLALWQAQEVESKLKTLGFETEIVPIISSGDKNLNQPLYALGITGVFTKDLDIALLNKEIDQINEDLHSIKYLKNAKIGSYFRLNVCVSSSYFNQADTLDYIIFDNGTTDKNNMASLISKNYSFKLNSLELK